MKVYIEVPPREETLEKSVVVTLAPKGHSWSEKQLGEYSKQRGVCVLHQRGRAIYVGKTDGRKMTFGIRLRRECQETAAQGRHVYPKLVERRSKGDIAASFIPMSKIRTLVSGEGVVLDDIATTRILEQTLIQAYKPELQWRYESDPRN